MKKLSLLFLCLMLLIGIAVTAWAKEIVQSSNEATKVIYRGLNTFSTYPVAPDDLIPMGWLNDPDLDTGALSGWIPAVLYRHLYYLISPSDPPFSDAAKWISYADHIHNFPPDYSTISGSRGTYVYRQTFKMSATAYNISGSAAMGSDNYGWLYLNGNLLVGPRNPSPSDENYYPPPSTTATIPVEFLTCNNVLAAEVQNGTSNSNRNGPTGVIFILRVTYELPQVVWQPPNTNAEFALQYGRTVPLKFKLYKGDKLITDQQQVKLAIANRSDLTEPVEEWTLEGGVDVLRFDPNEFLYIANFQTKNYPLTDGDTYIAKVLDACSGEELGYTEFTVDYTRGTGRSNGMK